VELLLLRVIIYKLIVLTGPVDCGTLQFVKFVSCSSAAAEYNAGMNLMVAIKAEMALSGASTP